MRGELRRRLDAVARAAANRGFHGNVLVASQGTVALLEGYGVANHADATPFGPSTVVQIGSNVKDFTKVAVLQLVEGGRLHLSDSLARFFPNAPADKRAITVRQLLEHRAGLPLAVGPDEEVLPLEAFLDRVFARPLDSPPGSAFRYSNVGYSLLAAIVERLAQRAFDAHLAQAVFQPAGMRETGLLLPRFAPTRLAHGYAAGRDRGTMLDKPHTAVGHYWNLRGNGGLLSTLTDMHRFYRALRDSTLLRDAEHRRMVLPPDRPAMLAGSDGVCFFLFGHFPGAGIEIIVASNHAECRAPALIEELQVAAGIAPPPARRQIATTEGGARSSALPETGPGRTAGAYIAAFNSGDTTEMRRFFETQTVAGRQTPSLATRLERASRMRDDLGRLTVELVRQTTSALEVVVRGDRGPRATLSFDIEPVAPFRLRGLRVEVGEP